MFNCFHKLECDMKNLVALLLCFLMITIPFAGCFGGTDEESSEDPEPTPSLNEWDVYYVESGSELPNCNSETLGRLYYVASVSTFEVCLTSGWSFIDIKGTPGEQGPAGVDGEDANVTLIAELEERIRILEEQVLRLQENLSLENDYTDLEIERVIDDSRAASLSSYQENNIVRDSTGTIHVVYRGVHNGTWSPMYVSSNGSSWDEPIPIRTNHYDGVSDYYNPSILVDNQDNLHVVFSDYGNIPSSEEKVNAGYSYPGWGYAGYYVKCEESCHQQTNWVNPFTDEIGGSLLPGTSNRYQFYFDMDVRQNSDGTDDDVFMTWREDGAARETVAYRVDATDGFTPLPGLGDAYLSQNIVIDNDNRVLFIGGEYYGEHAMKIYELTEDNNWLLRDKLDPKIREGMSMDDSAQFLGTNDGNLRHYRISTAVDRDNYIHILAEVKDEWYEDKWRMMYYEFNPTASNSQSYNTQYTATGNTEGKLTAVWVNPHANPVDNAFHPQIVVSDSSTPIIHALWWRNADPSPYAEYSSIKLGDGEFSEASRVLNTQQPMGPIKAIQTSNILNDAVIIDTIVVIDSSNLCYYSIDLSDD